MKCELKEAQYEVDWEEAERACKEREKGDTECRCKEAAKENGSLRRLRLK